MEIKNNASEINIIDGSDSHQEDDDVEVLYVDRRKRSSRSTVMSTENSESPVIEKNRFSIQEESEGDFLKIVGHLTIVLISLFQ